MASGDDDRRIVVGVDGSVGSLTALRWALDEARLRGAILEVVGTWTDPLALGGQGIPVGLGATMRNGTRRALRKGLAAAVEGAEAGIEVREAVICGRPAHVLSEVSDDADMLVVGSRGLGGFRGLALGSVSQQCAHHAHCPVVIVPPSEEEMGPGVTSGDEGSQKPGRVHAGDRAPRIVVGVDGSAGAYLAMEWAAGEARRRGAILELVTAWNYPFGRHGKLVETIKEEAEMILAESEKEAFEVDGAIPIEHRLVEAPAARGLLESSADADLLVVGSRGRGGFAGLLLGSVSQACAGHAACPVVVIRPREP